MPKDFDASSKQLFEQHPRDWLALLGWPLPPTGEGVTVVESDLSAVSPVADKLVRVDVAPVPYIAHVEFQTTGDRELDGRMLRYNVLARDRHRLPVRSVVFLFRPAADAGPTGRVSERLDEESWLDFAYRRVRLWQLPTEVLLAGPVGTLPLAPLTADEAGVAAVVDRVRQRLRSEATRADSQDMQECMRLLLGLRFQGTQRELLMPSLQKLIEEESWTYRDTIDRGIAQGVVQGIVQGVAQGRHDQLIELATDKFGPPDAGTVARIRAVVDVAELRRLGGRLLKADHWEDLFSDE